ncbi:MAG: glycosyltransferase [Caldilineaceae bacterium]
MPDEFVAARARLGDAVVHWGFLPDRAAYLALLGQADLVISTALHEFFGISVLEAIRGRRFPCCRAPELSGTHPDAAAPGLSLSR